MKARRNASEAGYRVTDGETLTALDVLAVEKPQTRNPLFQLPNVVLSPHVAFSTEEVMDRRNQIILENVRAYLTGVPIHRVDEALVTCP